MDSPVSIVMSIFNESNSQLKNSIDSILNQSFKSFEFIIILDNPKNNRIKKIVLDYIKKDKRIIFLENSINKGLAYSLNKGIKIAKGKYILRMDGDDISFSKRIEIQYNYLEKNSNIDFLFTWVEFINDKKEILKIFKPNKNDIINIKNYFFKGNYLIHPSLMAKKSVLLNELFDSNFHRAQDFELWLRTINKYKFNIIEKVLLKYRVPNKNNFNIRMNKIKNVSYWGIKALNKNYKLYYKNYNFYKFYLKLVLLKLILFIPNFILKPIIKLKDNFFRGEI